MRMRNVMTLFVAWVVLVLAAPLGAQEPPAAAAADNAPLYPLSLAVQQDGSLVVVDLNLPGLWQIPAEGGAAKRLYQGSKRFRQPMNRPRCVVVRSDGALLVGDTATREIYEIAADGSGEPKPLTNGLLGVPNSLTLSDDGQLYIGDLESRFVYPVAATGGKPELFSKTVVRGLAVDAAGVIWAATPTETPVVKLVEGAEAEVVIGERKFAFPNDLAVAADGAVYVSDSYANTIWRVVDGQAEEWLSGEPLQYPVGLAIAEGTLFVADPHAKQVFRVNLESKAVQPLIVTGASPSNASARE